MAPEPLSLEPIPAYVLRDAGARQRLLEKVGIAEPDKPYVSRDRPCYLQLMR